jgi:peptidoglycan/LPS O-acetylase OafA/YrhL
MATLERPQLISAASDVRDLTLAPPPARARPRYAFLDGIRGLAAFYVMIHHVYTHATSHDSAPISKTAQYFTNWLQLGPLAVSLFIILSGYCLTLPMAANPSRPVSTWEFIRRRALRILPPYYAALGLSLLLIALTPAMQVKVGGSPWDNAVPAFTRGNLLAHLFLVHNATGDWLFGIDPPMWSIAVEWQIYFVFILVLYPLWRRVGLTAALCAAFAIGIAPLVLLGNGSHPWYLGLFAIGMVGAVATLSPSPATVGGLPTVPNVRQLTWIWVLILLVLLLTPNGVSIAYAGIAEDVLVGVLTVVSIVALAKDARSSGPGAHPIALRILSSPPLVFLGAISYSLYLVHFPVISYFDRMLSPRIHGDSLFAILLLFSVTTSLVVAICFHYLFERPFMRLRR